MAENQKNKPAPNGERSAKPSTPPGPAPVGGGSVADDKEKPEKSGGAATPGEGARRQAPAGETAGRPTRGGRPTRPGAEGTASGDTGARRAVQEIDIDLSQIRRRAQEWIEANPTLAVCIGVGAGLLAGRVLAGSFRRPPVTVRARRQVASLTDQAGEYASEFGEALAHYMAEAAEKAGDAGEFAVNTGARAADVAGRRARALGDDVTKSAQRTVHILEDAAEELAETLREKSGEARKHAKKNIDRSVGFADAALTTVRTAIAAVLIKRITAWMKHIR